MTDYWCIKKVAKVCIFIYVCALSSLSIAMEQQELDYIVAKLKKIELHRARPIVSQEEKLRDLNEENSAVINDVMNDDREFSPILARYAIAYIGESEEVFTEEDDEVAMLRPSPPSSPSTPSSPFLSSSRSEVLSQLSSRSVSPLFLPSPSSVFRSIKNSNIGQGEEVLSVEDDEVAMLTPTPPSSPSRVHENGVKRGVRSKIRMCSKKYARWDRSEDV